MAKSSREMELMIIALKFIKNNPNCMTKNIKEHLLSKFELTDREREITPGRKDNRFTQICRNLTGSHKKNLFSKLVDSTKIGKYYHFRLNASGVEYIKSYDEFASEIQIHNYNENVANAEGYISQKDINKSNDRKPTKLSKKSLRYKTDYRLAKTAIINVEYKCEYGNLINENHITFDAFTGGKYMEAHHLIPMKAQVDFTINIDRLSNLICLCPICHRQLHFGTNEEKETILKKLYECRKETLGSEGVNTSYQDIFDKYYKK